MKKYLPAFILLLALVGVVDSVILSYEHLYPRFVPCVGNAWADCGKVLSSSYSTLFGIPLAFIGLFHYGLLTAVAYDTLFMPRKWNKWLLIMATSWGLGASVYFVYLQLIVIQAICTYCMISAINSILLFIVVTRTYTMQAKQLLLACYGMFYKTILKRILFLMPAQVAHNRITAIGEFLGKIYIVKWFMKTILLVHNPMLEQQVAGITFANPIGLSAGFDYEARLTQILPAVGFGFMSIGTITNKPYQGNPGVMLGRLIKSRSLLVNKGFKNPGIQEVVRKLEPLTFAIPIGISIGRTNTDTFKKDEEAIHDIISAFTVAEQSKVTHAYYELNISCPNLKGNVDFYHPTTLKKLLNAVTALQLSRPVFIKMPIEKGDDDVRAMLHVISEFVTKGIAGVIFGNLQKNREDTSFVASEIKQWEGKRGNFSGKPTWNRSNELIALTFREYGTKMVIIGCGGVFTAEDAYKKIRLGANLVQLITGLIYEGPQRIAEINYGLIELLKKDGFSSVSQAVGVDVK